MDRRTFLAMAGGVVGIPVEDRIRMRTSNRRMKSRTVRFSQTHYYSTDEKDPLQSPAEQFDNWRHSEKRDILAISLGETKIAETLLVIGEVHFIDVLYQIPV